jgi:hypothetical protein
MDMMDHRPLTTAEKVRRLRKEMQPVQPYHTYHHCDCGRGQCRAVKCWRCWRTDLENTIGVIHTSWLIGKIRTVMSTEIDIQNFIKSQEGGK